MMGESRSVRSIVVAYKCEPGRGSEKGAGWGVVRAVAGFSHCTVVTGPDSGPVLESWLDSNPNSPIDVVTIQEPRWAAIARRHRIGEFVAYLAWQRAARKAILEMDPTSHFDVAVHASLSAFWLPSITVDLGLPTVWGPVGGAVTTPYRLWPLLGAKGSLDEIVDMVAVRIMTLLPATRRTWRKATVCVAQNAATVARLPASVRARTTVLNHALFHEVEDAPPHPRNEVQEPYIVWLSPMEARKGPELAIRAFAECDPAVRILMVGDGPDRARTERLAATLGIEGRITFTGFVPHDRAVAIIRDAEVAVFTGLREEGGLALAEAMLTGTPVVVLANGGASTLAESSTDHSRVTRVRPDSVDRTVSAMAEAIMHQWRLSRSLDPAHQRTPLIDSDGAMERYAALARIATNAFIARD